MSVRIGSSLPAVVVVLTMAMTIAACGGGEEQSKKNTKAPTETTESSKATSSEAKSEGKAAAIPITAGRQVFKEICSTCHTLAAAGAHGTVGPNLDQLKPSFAVVERQVIYGGGGMPAFGGRLSKAQIESVAKYVSTLAGK